VRKCVAVLALWCCTCAAVHELVDAHLISVWICDVSDQMRQLQHSGL
jgi:hypothetical protein